ncbi:MAG: TonB-dependent receptor [bacterium]|nr:hypothetical protein [Deltaproteobacteria bacterium]MCP4903393.1 TonB-dependent receptor [bacterium]
MNLLTELSPLPIRGDVRSRFCNVVAELALISTICLILIPASMAAEEDPWAGVEEMLVTGHGGEGILATTGTSVTAFDGGELQALGVANVSDLAQFTPNLEIKTSGATTATLFIRGVGLNDFTANGSGAVAVYQDDVAMNLPAIQLGQIFDVSGIDVLKGPIGTGPGRNASAGAIKIYSNKPSGVLEAGLRFDYGNYAFMDAEGFLEVPIVEDTLSTRIAFRFTKRDGFVKNNCGGISQAQIDAAQVSNTSLCGEIPNQTDIFRANLAKDLNNRNTWAIRGLTRFAPPVPDLDMSWLLGLNLARIDQRGNVGQSIGVAEPPTGGGGLSTGQKNLGYPDRLGYVPAEVRSEREEVTSSFPSRPPVRVCRRDSNAPGCEIQSQIDEVLNRRFAQRPLDTDPFSGDYNRDGYERQSSWGGFLRGEWTIDSVTITSITGYASYDRERAIDVDYSPNILFELDTDDKAWQASQELRFSGALEVTPLDWEFGGYTLFEELNFAQNNLRPVLSGIQTLDQTYEQKTSSFAIYGEFLWELIDDVELEAGARYNWESKSIDADVIRGRDSPLCIDSRVGVGPATCEDKQTFDDWTGIAKLKYFFTPDVSLSMKYTRGWKGPQFNIRDGASAVGALDLADPEKLDALEWNLGGSWLDGRLALQAAFFWYSYQDYQVFTFLNRVGTPPQRIVVNASDARLWGAEIETTVEPIDGLVFDFRFGWLESKFLDFTEAAQRQVFNTFTGVNDVFTVSQDYDGNRLPNTPRFKISFAAEYEFVMGRSGSLIPRYDLTWTDDIFFDQTEGQGARGFGGDSFPEFTIGQTAYALHNLRLTYRSPNELMDVAGWVRNMTNEVYKTSAFNASQAGSFVGQFLGDPRTYGLSVSVKY